VSQTPAEETQEPVQPEPEVGLAELSVRSVLANDWRTVSIETEQTGPDGTEVLSRGMLLFLVCPLCSAVVPPKTTDVAGNDTDLPSAHGMHHIRQARDFDALNKVVDILKAMVPEPEEETGRIQPHPFQRDSRHGSGCTYTGCGLRQDAAVHRGFGDG
jgi:hypothetical protein